VTQGIAVEQLAVEPDADAGLMRALDGYAAASDPRRDGQAAGW
jgi:hypothetical protein